MKEFEQAHPISSRKRARFSEDVAVVQYWEDRSAELQIYSTSVAFRSLEQGDTSLTDISIQRASTSRRVTENKKQVLDDVCGMLLSVDNFSKRKKNKAYHFLTHAHSDHYGSLSSKWQRQVYCTPLTASLLPYLTNKKDRLQGIIKGSGVSSECLHSLPLNTAHDFGDFTVTLLNANHCPGAAMLFFNGNHAIFAQGPILFTGDFRADRRLLSCFETDPIYQKLAQSQLGHVYIDDTYLWDEVTNFPPRDQLLPRIYEVIRWIAREVQVLIPLHKLGKEDALIKIAQFTGEKIVLDAGRWTMREALFSPDELCHFVNPEEKSGDARIHVCMRYQAGDLYEEFIKHGLQCKVVNLTMQRKTLSRRISDENIFAFPYSDHSSFEEVHRFLSLLRVKNLHPWSGRHVSDDERWKILLAACSVDKPKTSSISNLHSTLAANLLESLDSLPCESIPPLKANGYNLNSLAPSLVGISTSFPENPFTIDWENRILKE